MGTVCMVHGNVVNGTALFLLSKLTYNIYIFTYVIQVKVRFKISKYSFELIVYKITSINKVNCLSFSLACALNCCGVAAITTSMTP